MRTSVTPILIVLHELKQKPMRIHLRLKETSQELTFDNVTNAYTKGALYCMYMESKNQVIKFPLSNVWSITEQYRVKNFNRVATKP